MQSPEFYLRKSGPREGEETVERPLSPRQELHVPSLVVIHL